MWETLMIIIGGGEDNGVHVLGNLNKGSNWDQMMKNDDLPNSSQRLMKISQPDEPINGLFESSVDVDCSDCAHNLKRKSNS